MTINRKTKLPKNEPITIGWIEYVDLPDLDLHEVKAKIDTGARTSALHATEIEPFERENAEWVRFKVQPREGASEQVVESRVHDLRHIKNTSGVPEERYVIRTTFRAVGREWPISVSLTDRSNMRFPMIVGRTALKKHNIAVHTRHAHLTKAKE